MLELANGVASYLESQGLGVLSVDIFVGRSPASPDDLLVIHPTGGFKAAGAVVASPTFQILVRSATYEGGWNRAKQVFAVLDHECNVIKDSTGETIQGRVEPESLPGPSYLDEVHRVIIPLNFRYLMPKNQVGL